MTLEITYPTTEKNWISKHTYQDVQRTVMLSPVGIKRQPLTRPGAKTTRYSYLGVFHTPEDYAYERNGIMEVPINRAKNRHFKPDRLTFVNNICSNIH